jgi:hypothetical protein
MLALGKCRAANWNPLAQQRSALNRDDGAV